MAGKCGDWIRRRSVKTRVTFASTLLLSLVLIVGVLTLTGLAKRSLLQQSDETLNDRINGFLDDVVTNNLPLNVPLTGRESGVVQIIDRNRFVRSATPGLQATPQLNVFPVVRGRVRYRTVRLAIEGGPPATMRIAGLRVGDAGEPFDIYVASDLASIDTTVSRLERSLFLGVPLLVFLFALIAWRTTKWALRPVTEVADAVDLAAPNDMAERVPVPAANDEIARLVQTMNSLLTRVAETRQRERRFAADASHELRTPLTTARLNLEIALSQPTIESLSLAADLTLVEIDRLDSLARDLLELTRLDKRQVRSIAQATDVSLLMSTEVAQRQTHSNMRTYSLTAANGAVSHVSIPLILRVVRNVLNNAERHAVSCIDVRVLVEGGQVVVEVYNDGASIAAADRARVFEPFTRLDEARDRDEGGAGLGLAIAAEIMAAHDGTLAIVDDPRGGTTFRLALPAVAETATKPTRQ
jgi:signal transduction histidine kinase